MLYGKVNHLGGMDIEYVVGLNPRLLKFIGNVIALPNCNLPFGAKVKAAVSVIDKRPVVTDYTEIKDVKIN